MRFHDALRGDIQADPQLASEDFIIHRRDGLLAYNLAVVVDDHLLGDGDRLRRRFNRTHCPTTFSV